MALHNFPVANPGALVGGPQLQFVNLTYSAVIDLISSANM